MELMVVVLRRTGDGRTELPNLSVTTSGRHFADVVGMKVCFAFKRDIAAHPQHFVEVRVGVIRKNFLQQSLARIEIPNTTRLLRETARIGALRHIRAMKCHAGHTPRLLGQRDVIRYPAQPSTIGTFNPVRGLGVVVVAAGSIFWPIPTSVASKCTT
jgi:hypothetical protein